METGLTPEQVKKGVARLRRNALIDTEQHLFYGKNVMHVRITEGAHVLLEQDPDGTTPEDPSGTSQVVPNGATLCTQVEVQVEPQVTTLAFANGEPEVEKDEMFAGKQGQGKTVAEVFASAKQVKPAKHQATSKGETLSLVWVKALSEATKAYVAPLTAAQRGKLAHFAKKCPAGQARRVMAHAVENWITFAKEVQMQAGLGNVPTEPRIEFLLLHAGIAVNLASKPTKQEAVGVKMNQEPVQSIAHPKAGQTITLMTMAQKAALKEQGGG